MNITALTQQSSSASSARVVVDQADGSFRSVVLADLPVVSTGSGDGTTNVQSARFDTVGDGSTDDTAAIQAAIDAIGNNNVDYLPPDNYSVNRLNVPHDHAIKFEGAIPWATTLVGRTAGEDIFRITDPDGPWLPLVLCGRADSQGPHGPAASSMMAPANAGQAEVLGFLGGASLSTKRCMSKSSSMLTSIGFRKLRNF